MTTREATWKGWLAGILDGEGCIQAYRYDDGLRLAVAISTTSIEIVDRLKDVANLFQLEPTFQGPYESPDKKKPFFKIMFTHRRQIWKVLDLVFDVLTEKKAQAKAMLEFLNLAMNGRSTIQTEEWLDLTLRALKKASCGEHLSETTPCQAVEGNESQGWLFGSTEGVETRSVSPNNNPIHECPAPSYPTEESDEG